MLTLTRKVGQIIRLGDDIQIVVKEIRRNHVRIGLLAPKSVKIDREEVYQARQAETETGLRAPIGDLLREGQELRRRVDARVVALHQPRRQRTRRTF